MKIICIMEMETKQTTFADAIIRTLPSTTCLRIPSTPLSSIPIFWNGSFSLVSTLSCGCRNLNAAREKIKTLDSAPHNYYNHIKIEQNNILTLNCNTRKHKVTT